MGRRALSASEKAERQRKRQEALRAKQVQQHAQECALDPHLRLVDDSALAASAAPVLRITNIIDRPGADENDNNNNHHHHHHPIPSDPPARERPESPESIAIIEAPNSPVRSSVQQDEGSQKSPLVAEFSALAIGDNSTPPDIVTQAATELGLAEASFSSSSSLPTRQGGEHHHHRTPPTPPTPPTPRTRASSPSGHVASRPATPVPSSPSLFCHDDYPPSERESTSSPTSEIRGWFAPSESSSSLLIGSDDPVLHDFLRSIHEQETAGGADFLRAQGGVYDQIFRSFFSRECKCNCPHPCEIAEPEHTHSLQERTERLQRSLPPLPAVFAGRGDDDACDPRASFFHWESFLSDQPPEPLSFRKTQSSLSPNSVTITRQWDIDSIWLGAKDLSAIRAPNQFRLSFFPPHKSNISSNQVIQPHGLDLAHTRHTCIGSFATGNIRFVVFLFFPNGSRSAASASANSLSLDRFRDLYDHIIIPAAYETIPDHARQEIPSSYDLIYAKSRAYQERPGAGRWAADDESRTFRLAYNLPAESLSHFWASIVQKADSHRVQTRRGEAIAYFQNPRLLFQSHDLKNVFARPSLHESLSLFGDTILAGLDPNQLDMHSCWLDVGMRDHVSRQHHHHRQPPSSQNAEHGHDDDEAWTLLWKSACCRHLHRRLGDIAPEAPLDVNYYRSCLLRDAGTYYAKAKPTRSPNPGHPEARSPGIIRAKAYNCRKELFGVMFSDYQLFSSGSFPLLAFDEGMLKDLAGMSQNNRQRAFAPQLNRSHLIRAWDANKRHLRAISSIQRHSNFGIRKEVTFRLDVILAMWVDGAFEPNQSSHTGPMTQEIPLDPAPGERHCPYWVIPTRMMSAFVSTQAARFILPLDHFFQEVTRKATERRCLSSSSSLDPVRQILAFYTAQLFCRLLIYALNDEEDEQYFDNWIWRSVWSARSRAKRGSGSLYERRGLGLGASIDATGMLWIPQSHIDWQRGHLSLEVLVHLYISRSPLQARLAHQPNVQALTATQVTIELLFQQLVRDAQEAYDRGHNGEAEKLASRAIVLAVEETARAYHQHFLDKIESYWDKVRDDRGRQNLPVLARLQQARDESAADSGRIPTAQTIHAIYAEAWAKYSEAAPDDSDHHHHSEQGAEGTMPYELPCWMTTRQRLPPKDSWSDFVFDLLFHHPIIPPRWSQLHFLQVYRTFEKLWNSICLSAGQFDKRFGARIGRYILVVFNTDRSKEVGTNHGEGTWYHGRPSFFQIQYWAPYFSPPRREKGTLLSSVYRRRQYPEGLSPSATPMIPTARDFQAIEVSAWAHWLEIMDNTDRLCYSSRARIRRHCRQALLYVTYLAGPTWGRDGDVNFIRPWSLEKPGVREYGGEDIFRVPVKDNHIPRQMFDSTVSQPTILLPTRDNVVGLLKTIESLPGHSPEFSDRLRWTRRRLDNNGSQYDIRSHLEVKQQAAEPSTQSQTLLEQFLRQAEPPQREIAPRNVTGIIIDEEEEEEEGEEEVEETTEEDEGQSQGDGESDWEDSEGGELW